ncbi:MAG: mandelate racemase/muconate lactonizing enzyme family protein [Aestuariivirgaceae bacterium]
MKITAIETWNFCPAFRDGPYVMSHVTQEAAYGRILRVTTDNGHSGLGEMVFAPLMTPEERHNRIASERDYLPELIGQSIDALPALAEDVRGRGKFWCGIAFGLDTAFFDLTGRQQNRPVSGLLGGAATEAVSGYFSVSERTAERIKQRITEAGAHTKVIQLKIGIGSLDDDTTQVTAALDAMSPSQRLLADANGGWSVNDALSVIERFDDERIVWEEPCQTYDDNATVARRSSAPVMVDQCVGDTATALKAAEDGVVASICIKPAFLGGLTPARQIRDTCAQVGMNMRIDGPWCGDIATAAILHLAVGAPPELMVAGADLREPLAIEPDLAGAIYLDNARIAPPPGPGLGITIKDGTLGEPEAIYASGN